VTWTAEPGTNSQLRPSGDAREYLARVARAPAQLDPDKYEQDEDGRPREIVGEWARDKHARLAKYLDISRAVRARFVGKGNAGASYIELFSGPGRVRLKDTGEVRHGSPLVAWTEASRSQTAFTQVHIADADGRLVEAAATRLRTAGAPVYEEVGTAIETVERIAGKLNKYALHVAFLDPYNLGALPFEVIRRLSSLQRMDILIHVSVQDLNRNLLRYLKRAQSPLDTFAPGWRDHIEGQRSITYIRGKLFEYWRSLLRTIDMSTAEAAELVVGEKNQPLYWLAFAARHKLALEFWERIRHLEVKRQGDLLGS
jgi:three-Cys-motif partner protein